jgi:G3E family GTPase
MNGTRITIIGGFLGSGKTTLLKRFVDWEFSRGQTPQVIMSEFGDFDVDGQIIADERLKVSAVTGGCICCSNRDELASALNLMLGRSPERPIYIETTGVADPAGVLQAVLPIARKVGARVGKVIVVYDASQHGRDGRDAVLIEKQLMTADIIVLNKRDLVAGGMDAVIAEVRAANPRAEVVTAVSADIDLAQAAQGKTASFAASPDSAVPSDSYQSFAFKIEARLARAEFEKWLRCLPSEVLRLKGFVRFAGENGIHEVQVSRGQVTVRPFQTDRWIDATLVVVSRPMSAAPLLEGLKASLPAPGGAKP